MPRHLPAASDRDRIAAARLAVRKLIWAMRDRGSDWVHIHGLSDQIESRKRK